MSMYPSLEDMKTSELIRAQVDAMRAIPQQQQSHGHHPSAGSAMPSAPALTMNRNTAYPSLRDFMGLELTDEMIRLNMPEYHSSAVAVPQGNSVASLPRNNVGVGVIAPVSGNAVIVKSMITHGVRHAVVKKDQSKVGLRVRAMNTGVFVCLVMDNSPAANAGIRFGDQILQIDGQDMAGMSVDKVHKIFKSKKPGDSFQLAIRDRPFERTVTLVRDSLGHIGFQFQDGKIKNIVKDSSAARNGLLTDHNLLEINGKNVIGLKDKEISKIIQDMPGNALNVTIMPAFLYSHMVKEMSGSLFGKMDHTTPDF
jgi:syntenin-1